MSQDEFKGEFGSEPCRDRWRKLKRQYDTHMKPASGSATRKRPEYFDLMQDCFESLPEVKPPVLIDNNKVMESKFLKNHCF